MKPGSAYRCPSKHAQYRCHRHLGHSGLHSAPAGTSAVQRVCRCGVPLTGDTIDLVNHVLSAEHAERLTAMGSVEHNHSVRFVDGHGRPVAADAPGAVPYMRWGCPACADIV